jgi:hypothetical protein
VVAAQQLVEHLRELVGADRGPFEQRDRCGPVGQPDDEEAHPTPSSALPPIGRILRCSWKDRICSSIARSTLRTSTPSRHDQHGRREVEDARDPAVDQLVADRLGRVCRGGDDADRDVQLADHLGQLVDVPHHQPGDLLTVRLGSASSSAAMWKPRVVNPP